MQVNSLEDMAAKANNMTRPSTHGGKIRARAQRNYELQNQNLPKTTTSKLWKTNEQIAPFIETQTVK